LANFNPADYETVAERIKRFYADHPDGRIITKNQTTEADRASKTWVVEAEIWFPAWTLGEDARAWFVTDRDSAPFYLKATGLAFEIDGAGMANKTSALENAETSAIGRALANAGYSGDKRASREEMEKVARAEARDWIAEADTLALNYNVEGLRKLYSEAVASRADKDSLEKVKQYGVDASRLQNSAG